MSEKNCKDLSKQEDIDGFLVGGASLKPACKFTPSSFLLADEHCYVGIMVDCSREC